MILVFHSFIFTLPVYTGKQGTIYGTLVATYFNFCLHLITAQHSYIYIPVVVTVLRLFHFITKKKINLTKTNNFLNQTELKDAWYLVDTCRYYYYDSYLISKWYWSPFKQVIKDDMWPNPLQYYLAPESFVDENGVR